MPSPDAVYDVLVREAGADPNGWARWCFVEGWARDAVHNIPSTRLWYVRARRVVIAAYPDGVELEARTNAALAALEGGDAD